MVLDESSARKTDIGGRDISRSLLLLLFSLGSNIRLLIIKQ